MHVCTCLIIGVVGGSCVPSALAPAPWPAVLASQHANTELCYIVQVMKGKLDAIASGRQGLDAELQAPQCAGKSVQDS